MLPSSLSWGAGARRGRSNLACDAVAFTASQLEDIVIVVGNLNGGAPEDVASKLALVAHGGTVLLAQ